MPYVWTVKTKSGPTAVLVAAGPREIEHLGSAHDEAKDSVGMGA